MTAILPALAGGLVALGLLGVVVGLRYIIRAGREAGEISDDQRAEVRRLLSEALAADRDAVAQIEAALKIIGG